MSTPKAAEGPERVLTKPILTLSCAKAGAQAKATKVETVNKLLITGKRSDAVLVAVEDWQAIQETLHLLSVPGMRESIQAGMAEPLEDSAKELDW
jgi:PHD/YefM family antitoxin component YafN of YafNO toxin-antitoxin module